MSLIGACHVFVGGQAGGGGGAAVVSVQGIYAVAGDLVVANDVALDVRPSATFSANEVFCTVKTAPVGQAIVVDVLKNGVSLWTTTPANRPTIAAGTKTATSGAIDTGATFAKNDVVRIDVVQIGTTTVGADLAVHLRGIQ